MGRLGKFFKTGEGGCHDKRVSCPTWNVRRGSPWRSLSLSLRQDSHERYWHDVGLVLAQRLWRRFTSIPTSGQCLCTAQLLGTASSFWASDQLISIYANSAASDNCLLPNLINTWECSYEYLGYMSFANTIHLSRCDTYVTHKPHSF